MDVPRIAKTERRLDQAARAAWLYYIAGRTQDEIAVSMNLSRQAVQRLVALAVEAKLIKFRLDHPVADAMQLAERLKDRFDLRYCDVVPSDTAGDGSVAGVAAAAAAHLETYLTSRAPLVLAFSTGRTLRALVGEVSAIQSPQHKIVSLVGTITRDGKASPYEIVMRLADRTGAQCYPAPLPVVASSAEECRLLQGQRSFTTVRELADRAAVAFVGVGNVAWNAPLHRDGFITDAEVGELIAEGAVGEIAGWAFDEAGEPIRSSLTERVTGIPLARPARHLTIGIAGGVAKAAAMRAALRGRVITGLVTDEGTAAAILELG